MPMDFHDKKNRFSYASRSADKTWLAFMSERFDWTGKRVIDIGCGGGIYSKAFVTLGAEKVIGLDFSKQMLADAQLKNGDKKIEYRLGDAYCTKLNDSSGDFVFSRALIHHLNQLPAFFQEAYRILKPGGFIIIQDRTPEDCFLPGSNEHLRGYLFEMFPHLKEIERKRRHLREKVVNDLKDAGFSSVQTVSLWEVRKEYPSFQPFAEEMINRTGKSILHELSDLELKDFVNEIRGKIKPDQPVIEKDRWTLWIGKKEAVSAA